MFGLLFIILLLVLSFKATLFILRLAGSLLGVIFSVAGYALIGFLAVGVFSLGLIALPVILIVGIISIVKGITSL